jgi:rRNA maturation protein Nop10
MCPGSYTLREVCVRAAIHYGKYVSGQLYIMGSMCPGSYTLREVCGRAAILYGKYVARQIYITESMWPGRYTLREVCGRAAILYGKYVAGQLYIPDGAHNTGQNLNTAVLVFLIYETLFSINFDDRCSDVRKNQVIT